MSVENLVEHFSTLEDPRCAGKVEHRLIDVLLIAVCAVIACAESWDDMGSMLNRGRWSGRGDGAWGQGGNGSHGWASETESLVPRAASEQPQPPTAWHAPT